MQNNMSNWISFWNSDHPIYVNARHRDVHYRTIARDVARYVPSSDAVVLDYGCGEALHADRIAAVAGRLILCDAAPKVRAALLARFTGIPNIEIRAPEEVAALPEHTLDLVVMHSVAQYLRPEETDVLFALFHWLLKPGGFFILGDVVPPHVSPLVDALALLRFGAANGFFGAALLGLLRTAFSDYPRLRAKLGISLYDEAEMVSKLRAAGFTARRTSANIGHNQARMMFLAQPA
jgi:SAM-dependent methyltransferase